MEKNKRIDDIGEEKEKDKRRCNNREEGEEGNVEEKIERCKMLGEMGEKNKNVKKNK